VKSGKIIIKDFQKNLSMNTKTTRIALMALIFGIIMAPIAITQAEAIAPNKTLADTPDTFFIRGDLTEPAGEAPFGGDATGKYLIRVNGQYVSILTFFESSPSEGMVHEGWLVDMATGYKLSLGQSDTRNHLFFSQTIVNPWIYDVLVITEEPIGDTDPSPNKPVGGILLEEPFGTA